MQRHLAGERDVARDSPEDEIRVGDGGLDAAASVARRPRVDARAEGPDAQRARGVEPGDAATARADGVDLDLWRPVRQTGDVLLRRQRRLQAKTRWRGARGTGFLARMS